VQQRSRDFAIRRALGASTADVLRPLVTSALVVTGAGALAGLVLAGLAGRLVATLLFGVEPLDPATFALVIVLLLATAVVAVAGPARRALGVDPAIALRAE
jgi:putative ABC transport system permease protein